MAWCEPPSARPHLRLPHQRHCLDHVLVRLCHHLQLPLRAPAPRVQRVQRALLRGHAALHARHLRAHLCRAGHDLRAHGLRLRAQVGHALRRGERAVARGQQLLLGGLRARAQRLQLRAQRVARALQLAPRRERGGDGGRLRVAQGLLRVHAPPQVRLLRLHRLLAAQGSILDGCRGVGGGCASCKEGGGRVRRRGRAGRARRGTRWSPHLLLLLLPVPHELLHLELLQVHEGGQHAQHARALGLHEVAQRQALVAARGREHLVPARAQKERGGRGRGARAGGRGRELRGCARAGAARAACAREAGGGWRCAQGRKTAPRTRRHPAVACHKFQECVVSALHAPPPSRPPPPLSPSTPDAHVADEVDDGHGRLVQLLRAVQRLHELKVRLVQLLLVHSQHLNHKQLAPLPEGVGLGLVQVLLRHRGAHLAQHVRNLLGLQHGEGVHLLGRNGLGKGAAAQGGAAPKRKRHWRGGWRKVGPLGAQWFSTCEKTRSSKKNKQTPAKLSQAPPKPNARPAWAMFPPAARSPSSPMRRCG